MDKEVLYICSPKGILSSVKVNVFAAERDALSAEIQSPFPLSESKSLLWGQCPLVKCDGESLAKNPMLVCNCVSQRLNVLPMVF